MTRHPGGRPRRRPRHRALLALLLALAAAPAPAVGQTDDDVRRLIEQLDDPQLAVRQQATTTLEGYVRGNQLTRAQLGILRTYPANPPLELLRRKEAILARWTTAFPSVEAVVRGAEVRTVDVNGMDWAYRIDGFIGGANVGDPAAAELFRRYEAARNAIRAADVNAIAPRLRALKAWVEDPANDLNFYDGYDPRRVSRFGREVPRAQVAARIQDAIDGAQQAIRDLQLGSNNVPNAPRMPAPANGRGAVDVGRTLRLALGAAPLAPGGVDVFMPAYDLALQRPPAGYEFVGELFDVLATDGLAVAGPVAVGIAYGATQLVGTAVRDPASLRLARLANGRPALLDDVFDDAASHVLAGVYTPESSGAGLDQFGEFAVVQPVTTPEPATLPLLGAGALALAGLAASVRRPARYCGVAAATPGAVHRLLFRSMSTSRRSGSSSIRATRLPTNR